MAILELINVNYKYEGSSKFVLKDVNAEFEIGKMYVIVGKNRAGKSTLLSVISGLDDCTSGSIIYKGEDLKNINKNIYRSKYIGSIFKNHNLLNDATVLDNIVLTMLIAGNKAKNKEDIVYDILKKVGIDKEKANCKVKDLSQDDIRRVCIARALSNNPELIICDDIIENTDDKGEKSLVDIFYKLASEDNKCVIITTTFDRIALYADELWGITNGNLMIVKSLEKLKY
ncbi:ATP-binding cassette domain-containing protein [Clostridioides difficile]|uniref:ATP-binding cassette domain-containing protein n=1 Tax=Clostridioides difficile TaxID=1496 RepID=UPI000D1EAF7E|nr:ABC transporter ATP-binding protein [Clostridioides difficile]